MALFAIPALATGSKVLVTGVNGLLGSHVADQLLEHGYKVRGTVRDVQKNNWMVDFFKRKFGEGLFELVEVRDIAQDGAFDRAVKGGLAVHLYSIACTVFGVVHVASVVSLDPDPNRVIPLVVDATISALTSAAKEESVQRFVLTSSATAAAVAKPEQQLVVNADSWNEESVGFAYNPPEGLTDIEKGFNVYGASKVKGEQALWEWVKKNEPDFVVNCVLPGGNFGRVLSVEHQGFPSTTMMAAALYNNEQDLIDMFIKSYLPEWFVDVQDTARLHVAALIHPSVSGERVFAYALPFNWNNVLQTFRKLYPDREFIDDVPGLWDDLSIVEGREKAEKLLKEMGRPAFTSLEESLKMLVESKED